MPITIRGTVATALVRTMGDGNVSAPSHSFGGATSSGMYHPGAGNVALSSNGVNVVNMGRGNVDITGNVNASANVILTGTGSAAAPLMTFATRPNTGIYAAAANMLSISAGGVPVANITANGLTLSTGNLDVYGALTAAQPYAYAFLGSGTNGPVPIVLSSSYLMSVTNTTRLTVSVPGLYAFGFQSVNNVSTTGRMDIYIYINGSIVVQTLSEDNGIGFHYRGGSSAQYLTAGSYMEIGFSNTGYPIASSAWSTAWMIRIA